MARSYHAYYEGFSEGVQYVTVVDDGGNPVEYEIPLSQAASDYGIEF